MPILFVDNKTVPGGLPGLDMVTYATQCSVIQFWSDTPGEYVRQYRIDHRYAGPYAILSKADWRLYTPDQLNHLVIGDNLNLHATMRTIDLLSR